MSPKPSRVAIISVRRTIAAASPKGARKPRSASVTRPCSKHSIAQATVAPVPIVSRPCSLQILLASEIAGRSSTPQYDPKTAAVSYSGPPWRASTGRPCHSVSTARLQRTAHA